MKQLNVTVIEQSLSKYISIFLEDLLYTVRNARNVNFNPEYDEYRFFSLLARLRESSDENIENLLQTLESIERIGEISDEQFRTTILEEYGDEFITSIKNEMGLSKNDPEFIIEQIKLKVQSRFILMLINYQQDLFKSDRYDVFLSHSSVDSREVLGIKLLLFYVYKKASYIDWIDDFDLNSNRSIEKVIALLATLLTKQQYQKISILNDSYNNLINLELTEVEVTNIILKALDSSTAFLYIDSKNTRLSKWMPYELGYAEAKLNQKKYRVIIKYKRKRKEIIKYNAFLAKYKVIDDLKKIK